MYFELIMILINALVTLYKILALGKKQGGQKALELNNANNLNQLAFTQRFKWCTSNFPWFSHFLKTSFDKYSSSNASCVKYECVV